eukprot:2813463-Prorocentrum_lima.AAC.1
MILLLYIISHTRVAAIHRSSHTRGWQPRSSHSHARMATIHRSSNPHGWQPFTTRLTPTDDNTSAP